MDSLLFSAWIVFFLYFLVLSYRDLFHKDKEAKLRAKIYSAPVLMWLAWGSIPVTPTPYKFLVDLADNLRDDQPFTIMTTIIILGLYGFWVMAVIRLLLLPYFLSQLTLKK